MIINTDVEEKEILFSCKFDMQAVDNHWKEKQVYSRSTMTYSNLNKGVKMETKLNINYPSSASIPRLDVGEKFIRIQNQHEFDFISQTLRSKMVYTHTRTQEKQYSY